MSLREDVEDALFDAIQEAGPLLPKSFVVRVPVEAIGAGQFFRAGGYTVDVISDTAASNCELATESLPQWIARHDRLEAQMKTRKIPGPAPERMRGKK